MRELSWKLFALTGHIDAYMLFKEHEDAKANDNWDEDDQVEQRAVSVSQG